MNSFNIKDKFQTAAFIIKNNGEDNDEDFDELNNSNEEMLMNDYRLRATVLPPRKNTIIRADSDRTSDQVIKPLKISDRGSIFSVAQHR